jgi:hypothetical protein
MTWQRQRLVRALAQLLVRRIKENHARTMAVAYLEDMGFDDCLVCVANRRRPAAEDIPPHRAVLT